MPTALQLITKALRLTKSIGSGESLTNDEATDGLASLNSMMESWSTQRLLVYQILRTPFTLTAGDGNYTVGPAGNINIARPVKLENSSYISLNGIDYPVSPINETNYAAIGYKSQRGLPEWMWYDPKVPIAEINFFPIPDQAYSLNLASWTPLQTFSTLTDNLALPAGYQRMIEFNLAIELAAEYGAEIPSQVGAIASRTLAEVKRINAPNYTLRPESAYLTSRSGSFQIYRG